jgi:hypothetical protein
VKRKKAVYGDKQKKGKKKLQLIGMGEVMNVERERH